MQAVSRYMAGFWLFDQFHGAKKGAAAVPPSKQAKNNKQNA